MDSYKKQQEKIIQEIESSKEEIEVFKKEFKQVNHDKLFYKRKEDEPAFDKTLKKEIEINNKIDFLANNIKLLEKNLIKLKNQEKRFIKTKRDMDRVLDQLSLGYNRVQASKNASVSLSKINKWYLEGKENKSPESIYFYNGLKLYENFYHGFFELLKIEFKKQNKIHILSYYIPRSYPQRIDRFYNEDSRLWFARLELNSNETLYYFGFKEDIIPKLILLHDKTLTRSNFRLYNDELLVLLRFRNVDLVKKQFKLFYSGDDKSSNLYYVSLGKLDSGKLSKKIELLISEYGAYFSYDVK